MIKKYSHNVPSKKHHALAAFKSTNSSHIKHLRNYSLINFTVRSLKAILRPYNFENIFFFRQHVNRWSFNSLIIYLMKTTTTTTKKYCCFKTSTRLVLNNTVVHSLITYNTLTLLPSQYSQKAPILTWGIRSWHIPTPVRYMCNSSISFTICR